MAKPADWLGPLIEEELRSVVSWKSALEATPEVKPEADGRFSDDGSNLRSVARASSLSGQAKVQISEILSTDDPVTLFVTDGFTRVKARLRKHAVAALESGVGGSLDIDTTGDVLRIVTATVESTIWGPSDGLVQLAIDEIEYLYHLRKPVGQPKPIHERSETSRLISEIERLRTTKDESTAVSSNAKAASTPSSQTRAISTQNNFAHASTSRSQRSAEVSQISPGFQLTQSPSTQNALATQIPDRRKPKGPTLAKDGFELEDGVNLSRPVEANFRVTNHHAPDGTKGLPNAQDETGAKLLSLLGKRKAEPLPESLQPRKARSSVIVEKAPATQSTEENFQTNESSPSLPSPVVPTQSRSEQNVLTNKQMEEDSQSRSPFTRQAVSAAMPLSTHDPVPRKEPGPSNEGVSKPQQRTLSAYKVQKYYRRYIIPRDQQKLLDRRSSWVPSLPGERFPHPNVPIELLKSWNSKAAADAIHKSSNPETSPADVEQPASDHEHTGQGAGRADIDSSSESQRSSEDEPFSPSQWPPTPSQRRPMLPPDSSMENVSRPSTAEGASTDHHHTVPGAPNQASSPQRQGRVAPVSSNISTRTPHAHPQKSDRESQATKSLPLPEQASAAAARTQERERSRPSTSDSNESPANLHTTLAKPREISTALGRGQERSDSRPSTSDSGPPVNSNATFMKPSPRAIKKPHESPRTPAVTLVKGTPMTNPRRDDDDDMEMEVPRSLGQDPAVAHRQRRSEHFKAAQRREWIKKNYKPNPSSPYNFSTVYSTYKKAHPKDVLRLSEFAEALNDVFPEANNSTTKSADLGSRRPEADVVPPSTLREVKTADLDAAVATPAAVPPSWLSDTPTSSPSRRKLPWQQGTTAAAATRQTLAGSKDSPIDIDSVTSTNFLQGKSSLSKTGIVPSTSTATAKSKPPVQASNAVLPRASVPSTAPAVSVDKATLQPSSKQDHEQSAKFATHRANETRPGPSQYNKPRENDSSAIVSEDKGRLTASPFREFAKAWKNLKPGGAFAVSSEHDEQTGKSKRKAPRLDVLSWELL